MHVHFREPGHEYKETIQTGSESAAAGGFTTVAVMPNTSPVNDNRSVTDFILTQAKETSSINILPIGAITKGLKGEALSDMGELKEAGCIGYSDDGRPVSDSEIMRRALEYSKMFGLPCIQHSEVLELTEGGSMNEGVVSTELGLKGMPTEAEDIMVHRSNVFMLNIDDDPENIVNQVIESPYTRVPKEEFHPEILLLACLLSIRSHLYLLNQFGLYDCQG